MDTDVQRLIILLFLQFTLFCTMESLDRDEGVISMWHWQQMCCMLIMVHGFMLGHVKRPRRLWAHVRGLGQPGFFNRNLLGSFNAREFTLQENQPNVTRFYDYNTA